MTSQRAATSTPAASREGWTQHKLDHEIPYAKLPNRLETSNMDAQQTPPRYAPDQYHAEAHRPPLRKPTPPAAPPGPPLGGWTRHTLEQPAPHRLPNGLRGGWRDAVGGSAATTVATATAANPVASENSRDADAAAWRSAAASDGQGMALLFFPASTAPATAILEGADAAMLDTA